MKKLERKYFKRTKLPTTGNDPIWYHIYQDSLPLEQVYRVVPNWKDRKVDAPEQLKKKGFKKRYYFSGWDNYTPAEIKIANDIKTELKEKHGIDIGIIKPYGPRVENGIFTKGESKIVNGRDGLFEFQNLVRYGIARHFKMEDIIRDVLTHFEWRQSNIPRPFL